MSDFAEFICEHAASTHIIKDESELISPRHHGLSMLWNSLEGVVKPENVGKHIGVIIMVAPEAHNGLALGIAESLVPFENNFPAFAQLEITKGMTVQECYLAMMMDLAELLIQTKYGIELGTIKMFP